MSGKLAANTSQNLPGESLHVPAPAETMIEQHPMPSIPSQPAQLVNVNMEPLADMDRALSVDESESLLSEPEYLTLDYTVCSDKASSLDDSMYSDITDDSLPTSKMSFTDVVRYGKARNNDTFSAHRCRRFSPKYKSVTSAKQSVNPVVFGSGVRTGIRAIPKDAKSNVRGNQVITGVFVTRLDPNTSPREIQQHIKTETGMFTKPEKLQTKYPTYTSFYIPGDKLTRDRLLEPTLWPAGTLVKLFRS